MTAAVAVPSNTKKKIRTDLVDQAEAILTESGIDLAQELTAADDERLGYGAAQTSGTMATTMRVHEVVDHVEWIISHPGYEDMTPLYLGPSGVGKTYAIREGARRAAAAMGRELNLVEKHVSLMGPTDLGGVPRPEWRTVIVDGVATEVPTRRTEFLPPADLPMASAAPEHVAAYAAFRRRYEETGVADWGLLKDHPLQVLFFDEFTNPSMPAVIHQCFPVIYGKFIANMPLVPETQVILAGNRPQDGTNSIQLPRSATLRVNTVEVIPSLTGWFQHWALKTELRAIAWERDAHGQMQATEFERRPRIHPMIIAYLNQHPGRFAPDLKGVPTGQPAPSPRTWNSVSATLYTHQYPLPGARPVSEDLLFATIAGFIGQSEAHQFGGYRRYAADLPDARKLMNSAPSPRSDDAAYVPYGWLPMTWPTKMEIRLMLATQMVPLITKDNARRFMRFMLDGTRFPPEVAAMSMKLLRPMGIIEEVAHSWAMDEFSDWSARFRHLIFA